MDILYFNLKELRMLSKSDQKWDFKWLVLGLLNATA